ncbi:hypothetical protein GCM10027596_30410 [Nocardioides korecus]
MTRTFTVKPSPQRVIDYLKDFSHAEEWDPGTESCTRNDAGPVQVGSTWHNVSKIAGVSTELTYELTELTGERIVLVGRNETATSTDTITVKPHGEGSEVTYEAVIEMRAPPSSPPRWSSWSSRRSATTPRTTWSRSSTAAPDADGTGRSRPSAPPYRGAVGALVPQHREAPW